MHILNSMFKKHNLEQKALADKKALEQKAAQQASLTDKKAPSQDGLMDWAMGGVQAPSLVEQNTMNQKLEQHKKISEKFNALYVKLQKNEINI